MTFDKLEEIFQLNPTISRISNVNYHNTVLHLAQINILTMVVDISSGSFSD